MNVTAEQRKQIVDSAKRTIEDFSSGHLEGNMGYKFQTRAVMEVIYLYKHGVDVRNPDLLGVNNKNTFVYEAQSEIEKIKEQVRLDIVDMGFQVPGASTLGRFIPKAANRKMLEENDFAETLDQVPDDAIDYGSGFLKVWKADEKMKIRSIDPFDMIFNQSNFKDGMKVERIKKKIKWFIDNEKYDADERIALAGAHPLPEDQEKEMVAFQVVEDLKDGKQRISVVNIEDEKCYYSYLSDEVLVSYYKFDCEKRRGFADALGIGKNERIFNKLVQAKVNRERMDRVMEVASILAFQKQMDNERDNYVGKEVSKLKPSAILGHKGNPVSLLDTGGIKQANIITSQLGEIVQSIGTDLNVGDALQGETLPSGTSGALGNLLAENQSSVHKEIQKKYANFLSIVYKERLTDYILEIFDSADNLKDYLDPNDIKLVEKNVINFLVGQKQVDAAINDEPFDIVLATEEVKREIKNMPLISGELLDSLRSEVQGIRTFITGEKVSKAKSVAFIRELRTEYKTNPQLFKDPFFVSMLKKEAEFEAGLEPIEIDNLLTELA